MGRLVQKKLTGKSTDHLTRAASGIILHKLIAGWDHHECVKVFTNLGQTYNLHAMVNEKKKKYYHMNHIQFVRV